MDDELSGYVLAAHCPPYAGWWVMYGRTTEREFRTHFGSEPIAMFETQEEGLKFARKVLGRDTVLSLLPPYMK